jgi:hypothetical protein
MSLSMSKCWYSNNCLHFLKHAVPLGDWNLGWPNDGTNNRGDQIGRNFIILATIFLGKRTQFVFLHFHLNKKSQSIVYCSHFNI